MVARRRTARKTAAHVSMQRRRIWAPPPSPFPTPYSLTALHSLAHTTPSGLQAHRARDRRARVHAGGRLQGVGRGAVGAERTACADGAGVLGGKGRRERERRRGGVRGKGKTRKGRDLGGKCLGGRGRGRGERERQRGRERPRKREGWRNGMGMCTHSTQSTCAHGHAGARALEADDSMGELKAARYRSGTHACTAHTARVHPGVRSRRTSPMGEPEAALPNTHDRMHSTHSTRSAGHTAHTARVHACI